MSLYKQSLLSYIMLLMLSSQNLPNSKIILSKTKHYVNRIVTIIYSIISVNLSIVNHGKYKYTKSEPPVKRVVCSAPGRLCYWRCYSHPERFTNRIYSTNKPLKGALYLCFLSTGSPVNGSIYSFKLICS